MKMPRMSVRTRIAAAAVAAALAGGAPLATAGPAAADGVTPARHTVVLPIPASPSTASAAGPLAARSSSRSQAASSTSRPTTPPVNVAADIPFRGACSTAPLTYQVLKLTPRLHRNIGKSRNFGGSGTAKSRHSCSCT